MQREAKNLSRPDLERALLDLACLVPDDTIASVAIWLHGHDFASTQRGKLWRAVVAQAARGEAIDLILAAGSDTSARQEALDVLRLTEYHPPLAFERIAREIGKWAAVRRNAEMFADALPVGCTADEALARHAAMHPEMPASDAEAREGAVCSGADLARSAMDSWTTTIVTPAHIVSTTIPALDSALGGGLPTDRPTVIAAKTGWGKSLLGLQIAVECCRKGDPAYYVWCESTRDALADRMVSYIGRLDLLDVKKRDECVRSDAMYATSILESLPLTVDDGRMQKSGTLNLDIDRITRSILEEHARRPLKLVVFDYITKLRIAGRYERPDIKWGEVSGRIAALCKQLQCPVLVLSQQNTLEHGKIPTTDNIAECKKVADDATAVLFIWSPDPNERENVEIVIAKPGVARDPRIPVRLLGSIQRIEPRMGEISSPKSGGGKKGGGGGTSGGGRRFGGGESHE